jgi:hypothetical protein
VALLAVMGLVLGIALSRSQSGATAPLGSCEPSDFDLQFFVVGGV